jgi:ABC-type antimicrobial peptide transport system permease subunit
VQEKLNAAILKTTPLTWAVRIDATGVDSGPIRDAIRNAAAGVPSGRLQSMDEVLADSTARAKFNTLLMAVFAGLALLMAGSGIYGVISYSVEQRTRELGIRIAIGAQPAQIRNLLLRNGAAVVLPGACIGFLCAEVLATYVDRIIFGAATIPPSVIAIVLSFFFAISLVAAYIPARQATRIDPVRTLQ